MCKCLESIAAYILETGTVPFAYHSHHVVGLVIKGKIAHD